MLKKVDKYQIEEIEGISVDYPYVFHDVNLGDTKVPWHWHEELEFGYVKDGSVKVITSNKSYSFSSNEAFFINTNVLCTMELGEGADCGRLESHLFHSVFLGGHFKSLFSTKYLEPIVKNNAIEVYGIRDGNKNQRDMLAKLRKLSQLQCVSDVEFQTRNILSEIWLILLLEMQNVETENCQSREINQERIQTMMSFVRQKYMEKLYIEEIAASASVSKRECLRCFRKCLHKTPYEYLLDVRIEMAQKYLKESDKSILEISFLTGFSNGAYFGKIFKKICQMTPGQYRKIQKERAAPAN